MEIWDEASRGSDANKRENLQHPESQSALAPSTNDIQDFSSENNSSENTSPFTECGNATNQETAMSLLDRIIKETNLNRKQALAFRIIAGTFIKRIERNSDNSIRTPAFKNYLRLLMTGPGGTGKTYVIDAVKKVLEHYNASHKIKCFAPTASATTLVDGFTIHKGFLYKSENTLKMNALSKMMIIQSLLISMIEKKWEKTSKMLKLSL